eukprot:CAMPEP_0177174828 /NCGR_PEP_ID=MMETSP0367-20130122/12383_1 /TAXON_ID=447022 ORGANISM="Scrippsiella hangoei-like, Strain SHHI-4" /NCGR_SAMPLE_ID=MMETSP0367 /ASSEMBLY_ACC=CAM_ASM_000362 /LENGTH=207 /DNA_ID=CAMNT_0018621205 /DNA_START=14 /DNA_END=637 /DNA_ORIENTATION=+
MSFQVTPSVRRRGLARTTLLLTAAALAASTLCPGFVAGLGPVGGRLMTNSARGGLVVRRAEGELQMGQTLQGTVTKLEKAGAILDLGLSRQGWLHVARIQEQRIEKLEDVLSVGQKVEVRVVKDRRGEIEVSMIANNLKGQSDFEVGQELEATVSGIAKAGVFFDMGAVRQALMFSAPPGLATEKGQRLKVRITKMSGSEFEVEAAN